MEFLTVEQVAAMLHRSPRTIQRWAREERIAHFKAGRSTLFTPEQLAEFAAANTRAPVEQAPEAVVTNPRFRPRGPVVVPMRRDGTP